MKTSKKLAVFLAFLALSFTSCSKDDDATPVTFQEENPLPTFLVNSGFNFSKATIAPGGNLESGFSFIPKVKGKIKALVVTLHVPNTNLRVTLWDKATGQTVATNYMNIANSGVEVNMPINEIMLQKDKEYVFSIQSGYYYSYQKAGIAIQTYPVNAGNISITGSFDGNNSMPTFAVSNSFLGDYSFIFQQTE